MHWYTANVRPLPSFPFNNNFAWSTYITLFPPSILLDVVKKHRRECLDPLDQGSTRWNIILFNIIDLPMIWSYYLSSVHHRFRNSCVSTTTIIFIYMSDSSTPSSHKITPLNPKSWKILHLSPIQGVSRFVSNQFDKVTWRSSPNCYYRRVSFVVFSNSVR